jgi:DNA-directed RNA polymerase specialized sigma subunit
MSERLIPGRTGMKADVVRYLLSLPTAVWAYIERLGTRSASEEISHELIEASSEVLPGGRTEVTALALFEQLQHLDEGTEASPNVEVVDLARRLVAQAAETRRDGTRVATELQAAVNELPRDQRLILGMHVTRDMTFRQIAQELKIPSEVVLKLLGIAYSTLRLRLGDAEKVSANHCLSEE